jgi:hypothetical protein
VDDGSTTRAGASTPAKPPANRPNAGQPPGLREQFGATLAAGKRLFRAHVDLAKAEVGEIVDEVKRMVALIGLAIGVVIIAALLFSLGLLLFLGEWLFGSIGWGVLLGTLLLVDIAVVAVLLALDVKGARLGSSLLIALVIGVVVGLVFGLDLTHRGWTALGDQVASYYDASTRTVVLALGASAGVGAVLGLLARMREGVGAAIGGVIVGAIVGLLLGWLTVISVPATIGAALGVLAALIAWPVLAARDVMQTGVDGEAIMKKFTPDETIGLTKETIEWVRARMPLAPKS